MATKKSVKLNASNKEVIDNIASQKQNVNLQTALNGVDTSDYPAVYAAISDYEPAKNEFISTLTNLISSVLVRTARKWNSPLKEFKKDRLMWGDTLAEVAVNTFQAKQYKPKSEDNNPGEVFKANIPDIKEIFHTLNREEFYEATINEVKFRNSLLTEGGLSGLVNSITTQLLNSDERDEYRKMVNLLKSNIEDGTIKKQTCVAPTDQETSKALAKQLNILAQKFGFISSDYNTSGIETHTPEEDIYIFVTPEVQENLNIEVLAWAFNMDKAELRAKVKVVDSFGDDKIQAVIADRDLFVVYDNFYGMNGIYDPLHLCYNTFLHHHETLSITTFVNAIALSTEE